MCELALYGSLLCTPDWDDKELGALTRLLPLYMGVGLNALVTILSIPIMIQAQGIDSWAAVGVGQTVGSVLAPIVGLGWAITGPAAIARATTARRGAIWRESIRARGLLLVPTLVLGAVLSWGLVSFDPLAAIVGMVSVALAAADASYFYLGEGRLWHVFWLTFAPRALGTAVGCLTVIAGADVVAVPTAITAGVLVGILVSDVLIRRRQSHISAPTRSLSSVLREQRAPVLSAFAGSVFLLIPTAIVGVVSPLALSTFVLYDRLTKQVLTLGAPLFTFLQGWVPRGQAPREVARRMRHAFQLTLGASGVVLAGFIAGGGALTSVLSSGEIQAGFVVTFAMGAIVALSLFESLISRVALVVTSKVGAMSVITVAGSCLGAVGVLVLSLVAGATGALYGIVIGMTVRAVVGFVVYLRSEIT